MLELDDVGKVITDTMNTRSIFHKLSMNLRNYSLYGVRMADGSRWPMSLYCPVRKLRRNEHREDAFHITMSAYS